LINKYDVKNIEELNNINFTFGAISYKKQFEELIKYSANTNLVEFYGNSGIVRTLNSYLENLYVIFSKKIDDNNVRYKSFLEHNSRLNNSVVLLNTPIIKSSILLSAINAQELSIVSILSTQLNYTPLLFSLTQRHDRKKLIIANSIGNIPTELDEYNNLIGNNLNYSWVNYATIVGVEYLTNGNIDIFKDLSLVDNQVEYPVNLYKVGNNSFKRIK
jgi:SRSO17 transposase